MFERFVFDGISSDEYGIMCVSFESASKKTFESQQTALQTVKSIRDDNFHIISQEYTKPLEYTIQMVKRDGSPISITQERALNKWLCKRGEYSLFCIMEKRYADIWFQANFNNPKIISVCDVIGLEYTVTTNSPFAFSDKKDINVLFDHDDSFQRYVDNDDEIPIYPDMKITLNESGNLELNNIGVSDSNFRVDNCVAGEILTIEGNYPAISSSIALHNVYNDFNKNWFYLTDGYNTIHSNLSCTIEFNYREYRKVGLV